jgi:hypothetical protein
MRPEQGTYPAYYDNYIGKVSEQDVMDALIKSHTRFDELINSIPSEKEAYSYSLGKWTVKQVVNHLIDTERIFSYRALRFARKDAQKVLPFEEDDYAAASAKEVEKRSLKDLSLEFTHVRLSTIALFKSLSHESLNRKGQTSLGEATVISIGFAMCGHVNHHLKVLHEKYL